MALRRPSSPVFPIDHAVRAARVEAAKEAGRFSLIERRLKLIQGGKAEGSTLFWGEEPDPAWLAAHPDIDPEYICRWCGSNIMFGPRRGHPHFMAVYCDCRNYKTFLTRQAPEAPE